MDVQIKRNIALGKNGDFDVLADLYLPANQAQPSPIIIFIHGGAFKLGSKDMYSEWGPYLATHGYATMAIDYRLATPTTSTWPEAMEDVQLSITWLNEHAPEFNIDSNRIGVAGDSVGAYFATMLALKNLGKIRCLIGVYGVYDLYQWWEYTQKVRTDDPVVLFLGSSPQDSPELYKEASPIYQWQKIIKDEQPVDINSYIIWGNEDEIVEPIQSEDFIRVLEQTGSNYETLEIPNVGHYWFTVLPDRPGGRIVDEPNTSVALHIINFLEKYM